MNGRKAEKIVKQKYGLVDAAANWCDLTDETTGARYEVKAADRTLASGREGAFRLWEDQHRSLRAAHNAGVPASYVFVTDDGATYRRRSVHTVTQIINDRGGWNESGHRRDSRQLKVPVSVIV